MKGTRPLELYIAWVYTYFLTNVCGELGGGRWCELTEYCHVRLVFGALDCETYSLDLQQIFYQLRAEREGGRR